VEIGSINGSHHIFTKPERRERIVIPMHGNQPLKIGLLRALMKIADVREEDL
jgi:predicted RNA binding protein YcfA (HicA-like mRNA interferase family)